jgi:hypothetical protein
MSDIQRILQLTLPEGQSAFLWCPRKTGKSTYLKTAFAGLAASAVVVLALALLALLLV